MLTCMRLDGAGKLPFGPCRLQHSHSPIRKAHKQHLLVVLPAVSSQLHAGGRCRKHLGGAHVSIAAWQRDGSAAHEKLVLSHGLIKLEARSSAASGSGPDRPELDDFLSLFAAGFGLIREQKQFVHS